MYQFEKLLKQNKLPAEGESPAVKKRIREFRGLETKIQNAKAHLQTVKTERKKLEIQQQITEAENALPEMDADICDAINKYMKNKDVYAANAERLKGARAAKSASPANPAPGPTPPADPKPDPVEVKNSDPAPDPKPTPKPAEPAPQPEKKKSGSALGWVAAAVGIVIAVIVGKNVIENR